MSSIQHNLTAVARGDDSRIDAVEKQPATDARHAKEPRRPAVWIAWAFTLLVGIQLVGFLVGNERLEWAVVASYVFDPVVLNGVVTTIWLTAVAMVIGTVVGAVVCLARLSSIAPLRMLAFGYVTLIRSVPPIVQLLFWFNLAYLFPVISIGLPIGPSIGSWDANEVITPGVAAVIGLSLYNSPYNAEILRSGLSSVPRGQLEAVTSLGLPWRTAFFRIQLPQAIRVMLPPSGSLAISTLKGSSLVSFIGMVDLLGAVTRIYSSNFEVVPLLIVAIAWYTVLVGSMAIIQSLLERRFSRGY